MNEDVDQFKQSITGKKDKLAKILGYLRENPQMMEIAEGDIKALMLREDPLNTLLNSAEGEITHAVDEIVKVLTAREFLI